MLCEAVAEPQVVFVKLQNSFTNKQMTEVLENNVKKFHQIFIYAAKPYRPQ